MSYIAKPKVHHPSLKRNAIGLTRRDYEGSLTTLCAGCGHDSITAAIIQAFWELDIEPHKVAKMSGIGCSSKTPAYFLREAHGFNSVHGRMPSVATGAAAANGEMMMIGISGDGDSLSIGLGQLCHSMRRNPNMLYVLENNGVYGLTKGQFSASADPGSTSKRGEPNTMASIDSVLLALNLGATFVARSFSGDKEQLVPILKAGLMHRGFAFVDVISPCVTFNDHEGSTKSYKYAKDHEEPLHDIGFVPFFEDTFAEIPPGEVKEVPFPDGSLVRFHTVSRDYDPTDRDVVLSTLHESRKKKEFLTGILYLEPEKPSFARLLNTVDEPLTSLPLERVRPSREALARILESYR